MPPGLTGQKLPVLLRVQNTPAFGYGAPLRRTYSNTAPAAPNRGITNVGAVCFRLPFKAHSAGCFLLPSHPCAALFEKRKTAYLRFFNGFAYFIHKPLRVVKSLFFPPVLFDLFYNKKRRASSVYPACLILSLHFSLDSNRHSHSTKLLIGAFSFWFQATSCTTKKRPYVENAEKPQYSSFRKMR